MAVTVVHFNPHRRPSGKLGRLRARRPLNNFGDLIGPIIVDQIIAERGLAQPDHERRLVTVGSIFRLTEPGDVVWGSGVNGKSMDLGAAPDLDVRAVRGPLTRELLVAQGMTIPEVYGDPALLWSRYWPRDHYLEATSGAPTRRFSVVPNHNDWKNGFGAEFVNPLGDPHDIIAKIAQSEFVCGSSLHAIVLAESLGIPARLIRSAAEPPFKYDDYYAGTGRDTYTVAQSLEEALALGGERPPAFNEQELLDAFPQDLFAAQE